MEFFKHKPLWGLLKQVECRDIFDSKDSFFDAYIHTADTNGDAFAFRRGMLEKHWEQLERPYYNLFPAILPMLMSLKLDIPCASLKHISVQPIEVRLSEGSLSWEHGQVKSVIFGIQPVPAAVDADELIPGLCIAFDIGEEDRYGHPWLTFKFFPLREDMTIEDAARLLPPHDSLSDGIHVPDAIMMSVVRLCACIALIDSDSDIITPDILVADKDKWIDATPERRLAMLEKARRRGKNGWNIGAEIQYAPHYRRPHPALVRVGKGRMLTRIVMRRGSVVHRSKLTEIPSGYAEDN